MQTEAQIQQECFNWFWNEYPKHRRKMFHIPNEGKKGGLQNGIVKGVPDLFLAVPNYDWGEIDKAGLFIEMKKPGGTLAKAQKEVINLYISEGYAVEVVDNLKDFQYIVDKYLDNTMTNNLTHSELISLHDYLKQNYQGTGIEEIRTLTTEWDGNR